jgi:polar amino acid transport system permease protein
MGLHFSVIVENWDYFLWGRTFQGEVGGLWLTILMASAAGVLSLILGISAALASWLGPRTLRRALKLLADFVRAVPLIFVIFWIYFLVPALFGTEIPGALSVIAALAWFSSGAVMYTTLAGLEALPRGHREAGIASGLTEAQVFASILLPQTLRNLVPSYVALFASMIKDTSLAYIMNVPELTMTANQVNTRTQIYPAEIFLFTAAVYFILCSLLSWGARWLAAVLRPGTRIKRAEGAKLSLARSIAAGGIEPLSINTTKQV